MHNGKIKKLINRYLDGEVSASERERVEKHLAECAACRAEYEALRKVNELSRLVEPVQPSAEALEGMSLRIRRRIAQERPRRRRVFFPSLQLWPQVASAVVVLFVACVGLVVILRTEEGRYVGQKKILDKEVPKLGETPIVAGKVEETPAPAVTAKKAETVKPRAASAGRLAEPTTTSRVEEKDRVSSKSAVAQVPAPAPSPKVGEAAKSATREQPAEAELSRRKAAGSETPKPATAAADERRGFFEDQEKVCDEVAQSYDLGPQLVSSLEVKVLDDQDVSRLRRDVTLNVTVDTLGNVTQANIIRSSGNLKQDSAVLNTVQQYRFAPAEYQNRRVKAQTVLRVELKK